MRVLVLISALIAGIVSAYPVALLAVGTYAAFQNFSIFGPYELWSGGAFSLSIACWLGYMAALLFCRRAFTSRSTKPLRTPIIATGLILGVVAAIALEVIWSPNPKFYIPWAFFLWPMIAVVAVGFLAHMWPNPALNTDAVHPQRAG